MTSGGPGLRGGASRVPRTLRALAPALGCVIGCVLGCTSLTATAASGEITGPADVRERPIRWQVGTERIRLPAGEAMGLVGGSLLFDVDDGWAFGPAVYAAGQGQRGGLFVGGITAQRRWSWSNGWSFALEGHAGGGGGASAPVGGGLMLRPAATLSYRWANGLEAGLSRSYVRFPSGDIGSSQWGLVLSWQDRFRTLEPPESPRPLRSVGSTGIGVARLATTVSQLDLRDGSGRKVRLVGARADWPAGADGTGPGGIGALRWSIDSAGAMQGGAAGYMEVLPGVSWELKPSAWPALTVGTRAALGLAGGGAVGTGGGAIGRLTGLVSYQMGAASLGLEAGAMGGRAPGARGPYRQLWAALDLDRAAGEPARLLRTEWTAALQHHTRAARVDGSTAPLSTIGLKLSRQVGDTVYLTGQAHSAYGGGAGAYSIGLVGAGLVGHVSARVRVGGEALVGAAGGGGVATGGGSLLQALGWMGWSAAPGGAEWRLGLGQVRAAGRADAARLRSPVIELSWTLPFGQTGP